MDNQLMNTGESTKKKIEVRVNKPQVSPKNYGGNSIGCSEGEAVGEAEGEAVERGEMERREQRAYVEGVLAFLHGKLETEAMGAEKAAMVLKSIGRLEEIKKKLSGRKHMEVITRK